MRRSFFITIFISLLNAAAAAAAAATIVSKPAPYPQRFNDVVAVNEDGSYRILNTAQYDALPAHVMPKTVQMHVLPTEEDRPARRDYRSNREVQVDSNDDFLNQHVAISPIFSSYSSPTTVSISGTQD